MNKRIHTITIIVLDNTNAYRSVNELLHTFGESIQMRLGYPMRDKNASVIFLIAELTVEDLGAFTGKLGQIPNVKVKAQTLPL